MPNQAITLMEDLKSIMYRIEKKLDKVDDTQNSMSRALSDMQGRVRKLEIWESDENNERDDEINREFSDMMGRIQKLEMGAPNTQGEIDKRLDVLNDKQNELIAASSDVNVRIQKLQNLESDMMGRIEKKLSDVMSALATRQPMHDVKATQP